MIAKPKIVVILGPTASGKTELGLRLAKKYSGEIISADSRQVYKKLDIGSAKPTGKWKDEIFLVEGVPHYLMDLVDPKNSFSLADFKEQAEKIIYEVVQRGNLPIIVGGTGLYVQALVENWEIASVLPDKKLREKLELKSLGELVDELGRINRQALEVIDLKNKRRVVRALEVALSEGEDPVKRGKRTNKKIFDTLLLGINLPSTELRARIRERLNKQFHLGLIKEAEGLLGAGYSLDLPSLSSIGYKEIARYLSGELTLPEVKEKIEIAVWHYAKRQNTWFKKMPNVNWINVAEVEETEKLVRDFVRSC